MPWLFVGFGWHWDDREIWHVTPHAKADNDFMTGRHGYAQRHNRNTDGPIDDSAEAVGYWPKLPITVVCPYCGTPQQLDAIALSVDGAGAPGSTVARRVNARAAERVRD